MKYLISLTLLLISLISLSKEIPEFDFDSFEPKLYQKDNKIHVVNFWATWCVPCIKELPYFEKLHQENPNVEVLLVSLDMNTKAIHKFLDKKPITANIAWLNDTQQNTWIPKVSDKWSGALPATVIYSQKKRSFFEKDFTYQELLEQVKQH